MIEDDSKFDNPWRRDGPLPDLQDSRDGSRRRHDAAAIDRFQPGISDVASEWRSTRTRSTAPEPDAFSKRKGSGFSTPDSQGGLADKEEVWVIGSKFRPSTAPSSEESASRFGSLRSRGDMAASKGDFPSTEEGDWRSTARPRSFAQNNTSRANFFILKVLL